MQRSTVSARHLVAAALFLSAGCASDPLDAPGKTTRIAMSTRVGQQPALMLVDLDGGNESRIAFTNVADPIPGNYTGLEITDATLLNLSQPRWDPSGERVAIVATVANDQSVVVIADASTGSASVASPNTQIIASAVDWRLDGGAIAYAMSTVPNFGDLDVFVTDLASHEVTRLTTHANAAMSTVRYGSGAGQVYFSRPIGETGGTVSNSLNQVLRVDVATKQLDTIRTGIVGWVEAIARTGTWALVLRNKSLVGDRYLRDLIRLDLTTGTETVLATNERLDYVQLSAHDGRALLALDSGVPGLSVIVFDLLDLATGQRARVPGVAGDVGIDVSSRF